MFLPRIKYSSQLDLPVCINFINYEEKTASSTLSQNNQTSWVSEGKKEIDMFVGLYEEETVKKITSERWR